MQFVNLNSTIGHDCVIGAYCNINPGCCISGNVKMGEGVDLGTGAAVIQGKQIGEWSVIGGGCGGHAGHPCARHGGRRSVPGDQTSSQRTPALSVPSGRAN